MFVCKTKKSKIPTKVVGQDAPSIKKEDAVYLLPDLEIIVYSTQKELKEQWDLVNPECPMKFETLWGWCDIETIPGVARIHIRSVRSHRRKAEFYHTLGHEVAHVLEKMEEHRGSTSYMKAKWLKIFSVVYLTIYAYKEEIGRVIRNTYRAIRARLDRNYAQIYEEHK